MCGWGNMPPEDLGAATGKTIERALAHAGATLENQNTALIGGARRREIMRRFTDYIWRGRNGDGICSACRSEIDGRHLWQGHKGWTNCPECGKNVQVRDLRYGHKTLKQMFYTVEWRKSVLEKDALVMVGIYCECDPSDERPWMAEKLIVPVLVDVFRYGKSAERFQRAVWGYPDTRPGYAAWHMRRDVRALGVTYFGRKTDVIVSEGNFRETLAGTPFAGGFAEVCRAMGKDGICAAGDQSEIISALARRPWIEYMVKAGFCKMGRTAIWSTPRGVLNPKGKNLRSIMKLSKDRFAELKGKRADIALDELQLIQRADSDGVKITLEEVRQICGRLYSFWGVDELLKLYGRIDRPLVRFLKKCNRDDVGELRDYLRAAIEVGIDLSMPEARIPKNLHEAHDRTVQLERETRNARQRKEKETKCENLQGKLDKRLKTLESKYAFEFGGLILRPARKLIELIDEGNALNHCVGSYVDSYADGRTDILFLRRAEEPDKPWRTIEFSPTTGRMTQDRGFGNDRRGMAPELRAELDAFWQAFAQKGKQKGRKTA